MFAPNSSAISYTKSWKVTPASAAAINAGQSFRTGFIGTSITLNFDVSANTSPLPLLRCIIDGRPAQIVRLASSVALTIPTETAGWPQHTLEVVIDATSEWVTRWSPQNANVTMTGITLSSGGSLFALAPRFSKTVEFGGDSITEGYHAINANGSAAADDVAGSSGVLGWAFMQRDLCGVEVDIRGFGGASINNGNGQGGVPQFGGSFPYLWSGQAKDFSKAPDVFVFNYGGNDRSSTSAAFIAAYVAALNQIIATYPSTPILALRPFAGGYTGIQTDIQTAIQQCSKAGNVTYADCTAAFDTTLSVDQTHPLGIANMKSIAPAVAAALRPLLNPVAPQRFMSSLH